ncbi:MAG: hypothetical protein K9J30_09285 [Bacteroidales bacterium]|nr:hypothetical protein [Bacteroidales bacterium]
MRSCNYLRQTVIIFSLALLPGVNLFGQVEEYEDLLQRIDTIENPVYKPHVSVSYGIFSFLGEVKGRNGLTQLGDPAFKVNISTFIDNNQYFAANFFFQGGRLKGEERSFSDLSKNLNFSSYLYSVGVSSRYEFAHFIPDHIAFRPYLSLGIEQINFNPKGDFEYWDATNNVSYPYYYWPDGTIRSTPTGTQETIILSRDYVPDADLRRREKDLYNLGDYSLRSFGIPLEIGYTLKIMRNMYFSMGVEYHYTFTDYIDNVAETGTSINGNSYNDSYLFTHATLHFDLFSDPTTRTVDLLYAEVEFDPLLFEDEDGDFILDIADHCPGTPYGVVTDTLGCPLDGDGDGVPDYLDLELETRKGAWVDDEGVTLTEEELLKRLQRERAMDRDDLAEYWAIYNKPFLDGADREIPEKFLSVDTDGDGYISFEELLRSIDDYFDYRLDLTYEELRELNEYFFTQ